MVELAGFCSDAATLIGKVIEVALTYRAWPKFGLAWKKKHPKFEARFLLPPATHQPESSPGKKSQPQRHFPPPSPSDDSETPDIRSERSTSPLYTFTDELNRAEPAPDSHFLDIWRWGKVLFASHQKIVALMMSKAASTSYPKWKEYVTLAYLEIIKAILTIVNLAASNREIIAYFYRKMPLLAFLYEFTYTELVKSRCMSQKARQGLFIDTILNSAASTTNDYYEMYKHLEVIVFSDDSESYTSVENAKPYIESRLSTPVVLESFKRVFRGFGQELSKEEFLESAISFLQKTRSIELKPFGIFGVSLPNHYILLEDFFISVPDFLKHDALLVVFLHELGHSLQRRHATTFIECLDISTPYQSPQASPPLLLLDLYSRFASAGDQNFLTAIKMIKPFQNHPKTTNDEAGFSLEQELFGSKVTRVTQRLHRFLMNSEVWKLPLEAFREAFQEIHSRIEPGELAVNLHRSSEISLEGDWCLTAKRRFFHQEDEEDTTR